MAFHPLETETIEDFHAAREIGQEWNGSPLRDLVRTAPSTKGSFARTIVSRLAAAAGVEFRSVPGRVGSRRRVGNVVCEIKFSTEDPARFQQVRPPSDGYDYLIGIGAHPNDLVDWIIPGAAVETLIAEGEISYQHAETSLWFFPQTMGTDAFSCYRMDAAGAIERLGSFV